MLPFRLASAVVLVALALVAARPLLAAPQAGAQPRGLVRGDLTISSSRQGAILSGHGLMPGDPVRGRVTIGNSGSLAGEFSLRGKTRGSARLAAGLIARVVDRDRGHAHTVYEGPLSGLRSVALGRFEPGEAHTFEFVVLVPPSAANSLQGLSASADFSWSATQAS